MATIALRGASGKSYTFIVHPLSQLGSFPDEKATYSFLRDNKNIIDSDVLYIGATEDASTRLTQSHEKLPCVRKNDGQYGGPYVGIHSTAYPFSTEEDLLGAYDPPCNKT